MFDLLHTQTPVVTNYFSLILLTFTIGMPRTSPLNLNYYFIVLFQMFLILFSWFTHHHFKLFCFETICRIFEFVFSFCYTFLSTCIPFSIISFLLEFIFGCEQTNFTMIFQSNSSLVIPMTSLVFLMVKVAQFIVRWIKWFFYIIFNNYTVNYETIHINLTLTLIFTGVIIPELAHRNLIDV